MSEVGHDQPEPPEGEPSRTIRALGGVAAAASIALTVAFVEPVSATVLNWDELAIDFTTLFRRLAPTGLLLLAGLGPLAFATCWLAPTRALALWTTFCVALWAQGDLFVWNYGTFDGAPLDWSAHASKAWLEAVVWLGGPALALWRPAWLAKHSIRILAGIVALQASGLALAAIENAPFAERPPAESTGGASRTNDFMTLSSTSNAIVIVLDMVQSDFFAEAMQSEELAAKMPRGFVYYRNAISLYHTTQFSLQSILTSLAVPDGLDALAWRSAVLTRSLPTVLRDRGFDSQLASISPRNIACRSAMKDLSCTKLDAFRGQDASTVFEMAWRHDVSTLLRLGLFRLAPHWLKPRVYDDGEWGVGEAYPSRRPGEPDSSIFVNLRIDLEVLDRLTAAVRAMDVAPRFRFAHFYGSHFPASIDAQCEDLSRGTGRERGVETTRCVLRKLYRFFDALEDAGVYDSAAIVVVSDHGHPWFPIDPAVAEPPLPERGSEKSEGAGNELVDNPSSGVPLFLVKTPRAEGTLRTSDRPVSLCDVPATVLDALALEPHPGFACESVLSETRKTPRYHYRYPSYKEQMERAREIRNRFNFERIRVQGHSWRASSWFSEPRRRRP